MLIAPLEPGSGRDEILLWLGLFEGEIDLYEQEAKGGSQKFLKIKRMYNQKYLESELPLKKEKLGK